MQVSDNSKNTPAISTGNEAETNSQSSDENTPLSSLFNDMNFLIPVSVVPTGQPRLTMGRIVLYINGATKRLYIYDQKGNAWHYTALT